MECVTNGLNGIWRGKHTGHPYKFTAAKRENWVDVRDVPFMLTWLGPGGEPMFAEVKP